MDPRVRPESIRRSACLRVTRLRRRHHCSPIRMPDVKVHTRVDRQAHTQSVAVFINGTAARLAEGSIAAALLHAGVSLTTKHVAVAVNDAVVPRTAWTSATLSAGDRIEIITAVAGG